jgi:hypothetical protein
MGLEGIVSKRTDAPYRRGPSKTWLKSKNPATEAVRRGARKSGVSPANSRWPSSSCRLSETPRHFRSVRVYDVGHMRMDEHPPACSWLNSFPPERPVRHDSRPHSIPQRRQAFTVVQQPGHRDNRGDTSPPAACLAERSYVNSNRRDERSNAGPAMGTSNKASGLLPGS